MTRSTVDLPDDVVVALGDVDVARRDRTAISCGMFSAACGRRTAVAGVAALPLPAIVVTCFVFKSRRRMRWLSRSQKYSAPSGPIAIPCGLFTRVSE